jgi:hypothetical protein
MDRLLRFLLEQPLLLIVLVAWIAGIAGNIAKAAKQARERAERQARGGRMPEPDPAGVDVPAEPQLSQESVEAIAKEMEQLLRNDAGRQQPEPGSVAAPPAPPPLPRRPVDVIEPERPPTPVVPTTQTRRLPIHVEPHIGEQFERRQVLAGGRIGERSPGQELGTLGGRRLPVAQRRASGRRYALDDLKRVVVLNEILGPPLALRPPAGREV